MKDNIKSFQPQSPQASGQKTFSNDEKTTVW